MTNRVQEIHNKVIKKPEDAGIKECQQVYVELSEYIHCFSYNGIKYINKNYNENYNKNNS